VGEVLCSRHARDAPQGRSVATPELIVSDRLASGDSNSRLGGRGRCAGGVAAKIIHRRVDVAALDRQAGRREAELDARQRAEMLRRIDTACLCFSRHPMGEVDDRGFLRHRKKGAKPSPNTLWRVAAFRNYADDAATDVFRMGLGELRALACDHCCAIMCAEAVWWRCHRRIIAEYLLAQGVPVMHIMGRDKIDQAKLTPGALALPDTTLVYPAADEKDKAID